MYIVHFALEELHLRLKTWWHNKSGYLMPTILVPCSMVVLCSMVGPECPERWEIVPSDPFLWLKHPIYSQIS